MRGLFIFLAVLATPAAASDCAYFNNSGDRVAFVQDGENTVTLDRAKGLKTACTWAVTGGAGYEDIECKDGTKAAFFFAPQKRGGSDQGLLVFNDDVWYQACGDAGL